MIRLTWISAGNRARPNEYDTDSVADALSAFAAQSFASNRSPAAFVMGVVIERGDARLTDDEIAEQFEDIGALERLGLGRSATNKGETFPND